MTLFTINNQGLSSAGGGISRERIINKVDDSKFNNSKLETVKKLRVECLDFVKRKRFVELISILNHAVYKHIISPDQAHVFWEKYLPPDWQM